MKDDLLFTPLALVLEGRPSIEKLIRRLGQGGKNKRMTYMTQSSQVDGGERRREGGDSRGRMFTGTSLSALFRSCVLFLSRLAYAQTKVQGKSALSLFYVFFFLLLINYISFFFPLSDIKGTNSKTSRRQIAALWS